MQTRLSIKAGESVALEWSTTNAESIFLDQGLGTVDPSGSGYVYPTEDTIYTITVTGPGGTVTKQAAVAVTPSPITLTITSPTDNATLTRPDVMVTGTVSHADGLETGVVVNGVIALVYDGQFVANHVPLTVGENTITVKAMDASGEGVEKTLTVTTDLSYRYVKLSTDVESGLPPLNTTLRLSATFPSERAPVFSGLGSGDVVYTDTDTSRNVNVSMNEPGFYFFSIELRDNNDVLYTDKIALLLMDQQQFDTLLQAKWSAVKQALSLNQINSALTFFLKSSQTIYKNQFEFMVTKGILPQLVNKIGTFRLVEHDGYGVIYDLRTVKDDVEYSFQVLFIQDADGIWRIKNY